MINSMCPTMPMALGTDSWNADAFGATSAVFRVSSKVSSAASSYADLLSLAGKFWRIDRQLKNLLERFYGGVENPPPQVVAPSEESLRSSLAALRTLCGKIDELYNIGKAHGLTNRTLVGTVLNSIRVRSDELLDIAESVELSMCPEVTAPLFDKALAELERGETFDLASIR
jgi:hypothetical protein